MRIAALVTAVALVGTVPVENVSYRETRARLFANAYDTPPKYFLDAFPELAIVPTLLNGYMARRFNEILASEADFKPARLKPVHRAGICMEATWWIDASSAATGLFEKGTRVPAIVRFAVGSNRTNALWPLPRTFGMAVKVFPTQNPDEQVHPRNLLLFDQHGLDGDTRPYFLRPGKGDQPLAFSNVIDPELPHAVAVNAFLGLFDDTPAWQPLHGLTAVDGHNRPVAAPITPVEVHLIPRAASVEKAATAGDYRDELRSFAPGALIFDIVLPEQAVIAARTTVGTLTIGETVMSPVCDESLVFSHHD